MITLLKWTLLRAIRRRHPEMFDGTAALAAVNQAIDDLTGGHR